MSEDDNGMTDAEVRAYWWWLRERDRQRVRRWGWYWRLRNWLMRFEKSCGRGCSWEAPYGFVPEAGCPRHDA